VHTHRLSEFGGRHRPAGLDEKPQRVETAHQSLDA
jgi:hypothetical protein